MKKVLLFLIDSMMPDVLEQCVAQGKTPGFRFLLENGQYIPDCVTVFPTMTASVDCSLITGVYPDQHKVPGLVWYDPSEQKIINYINSAQAVLTLGITHCATNVLYDLNERHLSRRVKTIHEELEENGFTSGSINVIAHRGHKRHKLHVPFPLRLSFGSGFPKKVSGPAVFFMGTFAKPSIFRPIPWSWSQSPIASFGINDAHAIDVLIEVVKSGQQPDFTLVYMPDNDHKIHQTPSRAEDHLAAVDEQLVRFLDTFSSWRQALEQNVFLLISDHGQTVIGSSASHNIFLDDVLAGLRIHPLGQSVRPDDELVVCNNERMAYLYPLASEIQPRLIERLAAEERIDQVAWKENEWVHVRKAGTQTLLSFRKGGPFRDWYGVKWEVKGDGEVLDLRIERGEIGFDAYPDALSRLYGALFSQDHPVVVITARPGYEFVSECAPTHLGGGSHGSLHKTDSLIPLVIAGTSRPFPRPARLIDVKSFVLEQLAVQAAVT